MRLIKNTTVKKLTLQEQELVTEAYPIIFEVMKEFNFSENDIEDWHGILSVALCEFIMQNKNYIKLSYLKKKDFLKKQLYDYVFKKIKSNKFKIKEIPVGLKPVYKPKRGKNI